MVILDKNKAKERLSRIEKRLKDKEIIDKCLKLAKEHGKGDTQVYDFNTHESYKLRNENLEIIMESGMSQMGGKYVEVSYNGKKVLNATSFDVYMKNKEIRKLLPEIDGYYIFTYKEGVWEEELIEMLEKPKREKVTKKSRPMKKESLDYLIENFSAF